MLTGCDLSYWNAPLGGNDLDFVIPKATQGAGYRDPMFARHIADAHARGQIILAYHFGERGEGSAGAHNFLSAIAPVAHLLSGVCFDCEFQDSAQSFGPYYADAVAWNQTVAAALPGMARYLYTAAFYWSAVLANPPAPAGMRLWWAHLNNQYNATDPHVVANATTKPPLPDFPSWPDYAIRQVGWNARIGGSQPCDVDITYMTRAQLAAGTSPAPSTDWFDMASTTDLENAVRKVLNEGTAAGQQNWAGTNKALLAVCQGLVNQNKALAAALQVAILGGSGHTGLDNLATDLGAETSAIMAELNKIAARVGA